MHSEKETILLKNLNESLGLADNDVKYVFIKKLSDNLYVCSKFTEDERNDYAELTRGSIPSTDAYIDSDGKMVYAPIEPHKAY